MTLNDETGLRRVQLNVSVMFAAVLCMLLSSDASAAELERAVHYKVHYEDGRFAAWPANGGMWAWGEEILVCYTLADHEDSAGHTYNGATARNMFARSLDGGETWTVEDAFEQGITGQAMNHRLGDRARPIKDLTEPIDFTHRDFALLFQRESNHSGPAHFYYTYDRGKSWAGPFRFPQLDETGITNRTDYIINGKHEMFAFLSIGHGRTGVAATEDGGLTWRLRSYVGPDFTRTPDYSLMPASVRLSADKLYTVVRHREKGHVWLTAYLSQDNGQTWKRLDDPVAENMNTPADLVVLPDGRLVLVYVFRRHGGEGSSVCARVSTDEGRSWSEEIVLRQKDGANWDVGYPRVVQRADGKLVVVYYWNHALDKKSPHYRYIAATAWDPQ